MKKNKVLIIRFSSFGDIVQNSVVVELIHQNLIDCEIHWVTRNEFKNLVELNQHLDKVITINKADGIWGLLKLAIELRAENYTHIYDAHHNLRSFILKLFLLFHIKQPMLIVRSKDRIKRILLFYFRINLFPKPFKGIFSYIAPLKKWFNISDLSPISVQWKFPTLELNLPQEKFITLVPSAAWLMKRWPIEHWKKLISLLPGIKIVILGGSEDYFCEEIHAINPKDVTNLAGKLTLIESCKIIQKSHLIVSADTGLLHVADVLGVSAISLMGPTAFGFTTNPKIKTLEINLPCRPCSKDGRGKCSQSIYQKCMVDITPEQVAAIILKDYFLTSEIIS